MTALIEEATNQQPTPRAALPAPGFTAIPNDLYLCWMPQLDETEFKVLSLLTYYRMAAGEPWDDPSREEIVTATGRPAVEVKRALECLMGLGLVTGRVKLPGDVIGWRLWCAGEE